MRTTAQIGCCVNDDQLEASDPQGFEREVMLALQAQYRVLKEQNTHLSEIHRMIRFFYVLWWISLIILVVGTILLSGGST